MIDRAAIKLAVRTRLRGKWGRCFLACLIPMAVPLIFTITGYSVEEMPWPIFSLFMVATIFVTLPMQVTLSRFFLRFLYEEDLPSPVTVTDCFSGQYGRCLAAPLWMMLCMLAWVLLPSILLGILLGLTMLTSVSYDLWVILYALCYLLIMVVLMNRAYAYSMALYLTAEFPKCSARQALRASKALTQGYKGNLFVLSLSFILWELLVSITFGIAGIYVIPYTQGVQAAYYVELRTRHPERIADILGDARVKYDEEGSSGHEN